MSSFTNYPILIAESMNPFFVSVAFKCELCGKVSRSLEHDCSKEKQMMAVKESFRSKIKKILSSLKIPKRLEE
ncbi:MAG: hypothetical protein KAI79_20065 [Bacteroidales bacterium]|nr:hypothetical protein [Bacteroidales bacterium]